MQAVGDKMQSIGKGLSVAVTAPLVAAGTAAVKVGADFQSSMGTIQARTGMAADEVKKLGKEFRQMALSGDYGAFTAREISAAYASVAVNGQDAEQATNIMRSAMVMSTATGSDLAATAYFLSNYLLKVGKDASESEKYINLFTRGIGNTGIGLADMQNYMFRMTPAFQQFGASSETNVAILTRLYQAGIRGANLYSGMGTIMMQFATESGKAADMAQAFSSVMAGAFEEGTHLSETLSEASKETISTMWEMWEAAESNEEQMFALAKMMQGTTDVLEQYGLESKIAQVVTENLTATQQAAWFEFMNLADEIKNEVIPGFYEATDAVEGTGIAFEKAAMQQDGLIGSSKQIRASLEEIKLQISDHLLPHVQTFLGVVNQWMQRFASLDESTQRTVLKIEAIAAAIGPILVIGGKLIATAGKITAAFGKLSKIIGAAGGLKPALAMLKLAFAPIALKIAPIIAAGVLLYKNWDTVREKAQALWQFLQPHFEKIREFFTAWGQQVGGLFSEAFATIKEFAEVVFGHLKAFWERWGGTITTMFAGWWNHIKIVAETIFNLISNVIKSAMEVIEAVIRTVTAVIRGDWEGAWQGIKDVVSAAWSGIKRQFMIIVNGIKNVWGNLASTMVSIGKDIIQGLINGITGMARAAVDSVRNLASDMASAITGFFGIRSPARRTKGYGRDIGLGMLIGIESQRAALIGASRGISESIAENLQIDPSRLASEVTLNSYEDMLADLERIASNSGSRILSTELENIDRRLNEIRIANEYRIDMEESAIEDLLSAEARYGIERMEHYLRFNEDIVQALSGHHNELIEMVKRAGQDESGAIEDSLSKQIRARIDIIEKHVQAVQDSTKAIIEEYDKQHRALMDSLDYKESEQLSALQNRIDALDAQTEAENRALREQQSQRRLHDLQAAVDSAETDEDRLRALERFNDEQERQQREALQQARREEQNSLRQQMQEVRQNYRERREEASTNHEAQVAQAKENERIQLEFLNALHQLEQENFNRRLQELEEYIKQQAQAEEQSNDEQRNRQQQQNRAISSAVNAHHRDVESATDIYHREMEATADAHYQSLIDTITSYAPEWQRAGRSAADAFLEELEAAVPASNSAGINIAEGVANGITSGSGLVSGAAQGMISGALAAMRAAAEIASPSRKTRKMGRQLIDGMLAGFDSKIGELTAYCKQITNKITDSLQIDTSKLASDAQDVLKSLHVALPALESNINHHALQSQPTPSNHQPSQIILDMSRGQYYVREDADIDKIATAIEQRLLDRLENTTRFQGGAMLTL